jgi:hypothetical protein
MAPEERPRTIGLRLCLKRVCVKTAAMIVAAVLASCATVPPAEKGVPIAPGVYFSTPTPAELGYTVNTTQLITARFRGQTYVFQTQVTISPDRLVLIGLDPFGRRALTVTSTASGMTTEAEPWVPAGLRVANILADMAIVYWPEKSVRRGLDPAKATLDATPQSRTITADGREIIRVEYGPSERTGWAMSARYVNIAYGYELDLRSVPE